jgi:hypothetical protein
MSVSDVACSWSTCFILAVLSASWAVVAVDVGDEVFDELGADLVGCSGSVDGVQGSLGGGGCQRAFHAARDQFPQESMQLVEQPGAMPTEGVSPLVQKREGVGVVLGGDRSALPADRCRAGRRGGIDRIILAAASAGKCADLRGGGRGNVDHGLATADQPLHQVMTKPLGVFDGPVALRPPLCPVQQPTVFGLGRGDGEGVDRRGCWSVDGSGGVGRLVRVDTEESEPVGRGRGRQADFQNCGCCMLVIPLSSQAADGSGRGDRTIDESTRRAGDR